MIEQGDPEFRDRLIEWYKQSEARFHNLSQQPGDLSWPVSLIGNHYQLAYLILTRELEKLPDHRFYELLLNVVHRVDHVVNTGWSMFYPVSSVGVPSFRAEWPDGTGEDVCEQNLMTAQYRTLGLPDFWRIALDGRASICRAYLEDRLISDFGGNRVPERWLDPETVIRDTTEVVIHAKLLAQQFRSVSGIWFRCAWRGLEGRLLYSMRPGVLWRPRILATSDLRITEGFWSMESLEKDWTTTVAELSAPVLRIFGFTNCTPKLIKDMSPRFRM